MLSLKMLNQSKDLGVLFDSHLTFGLHISEKINKAYSILGMVRRNFTYLNKDAAR